PYVPPLNPAIPAETPMGTGRSNLVVRSDTVQASSTGAGDGNAGERLGEWFGAALWGGSSGTLPGFPSDFPSGWAAMTGRSTTSTTTGTPRTRRGSLPTCAESVMNTTTTGAPSSSVEAPIPITPGRPKIMGWASFCASIAL